jgi:hypothetical protein
VGPGSSVGIATGYGLDGPGIESQRKTRFFAYVQPGPGAHPMGTGPFPGVKWLGRVADHILLLTPKSRKSIAIYLPPLGLRFVTVYPNLLTFSNRASYI